MIGKLLAVTASGLMLAAALPKFNLTFFLWIGLIPFLWALQGVQGRKAFILGYCNGLAQNLLMLYWIIYVTVIYGKLPLPVGIILLILLAGYISHLSRIVGPALYLGRKPGTGRHLVGPGPVGQSGIRADVYDYRLSLDAAGIWLSPIPPSHSTC